MYLVKGEIQNTKLIPMCLYNMDSPYNHDIDTTDGVMMDTEPNPPVCDIVGKQYTCYIDLTTKHYIYELVDRPLTLEEKLQTQEEVLDMLLLDRLGV